ncbi:putative necrosis-inducing factor-domain-containing protein [Podospora appendiculata]|uniref:Necrosis-inducing factor-domain-containing protein n=1 Tax=Podospora appendiculata TaxID=314037 RepID=A0AAE1CCY4_9PEZI|nr:putative necrosis-inducing factor-domain-containing protein [Podospora appendiculata]
MDSINDCQDSTFTNQASARSPLASDCDIICKNIAGGGTWTVQSATQHQLVQYGTCAWGVEGNYKARLFSYKVGNQDIIDTITDSIRMFTAVNPSGDPVVQSYGYMSCQGLFIGEGYHPVKWGLYRNPGS